MERKTYGVIEQNTNVFFVIDGFQCTFIYNTDAGSDRKIILNHKDGFILGRVIGEKITDQYIYIYTNKNIEILEKRVFNIWLFLISGRPSLESYSGIRFKGGVLRKLFSHAQWNVGYEQEGTMTVKFADNQISYSLNNEKVRGSISIGSSVHGSRSRENGSSISTTATELELAFENEKGLASVPEIIIYILNLCRFMAFRKNIRFDEIGLVNPNSNLANPFDKIASCYFCFDEPSDITKSSLRCLSFNILGEHIDNLLNCIVEGGRSKNKNFNINFLPETDKEVNLISSMRIREIFSALEAELDINEITTQSGTAFENLINMMKQVVKEHRKGETPLSDPKEYDYIFGTLGHMAGPLANRIYKFLQENKSLIRADLSREQVETLVKYRNSITHGEFFILDLEKGETALVLIRLIYCSILKRIGLEEDKIGILFERDILL